MAQARRAGSPFEEARVFSRSGSFFPRAAASSSVSSHEPSAFWRATRRSRGRRDEGAGVGSGTGAASRAIRLRASGKEAMNDFFGGAPFYSFGADLSSISIEKSSLAVNALPEYCGAEGDGAAGGAME